MIVCKGYKDGYKEVINNEEISYVFAELYTSDETVTPPTNAEGIKNFPQSYNLTKVRFLAGSTFFNVKSGNIYIIGDDNIWYLQ